MPMEFGYPTHESCNIPSRTKIHSEKRFVFLGKPPFHPCLYMNGRAFEMVFLFAAHQIFRLAVISDTGNEWRSGRFLVFPHGPYTDSLSEKYRRRQHL